MEVKCKYCGKVNKGDAKVCSRCYAAIQGAVELPEPTEDNSAKSSGDTKGK